MHRELHTHQNQIALEVVFEAFHPDRNLFDSYLIYNLTMIQRILLLVVLAIAALSSTEVCFT
jgi:hypothetical protein